MALHWDQSGHAILKIFCRHPMSGKRRLDRLCRHEGATRKRVALMAPASRSISSNFGTGPC